MRTVDDDNIQGARLPDSLADADPFAAPSPSRRASAASRSPVTAHRGTAAGGTSPGSSEPMVPCPCSCACGNDTAKTFASLESLSAARHLRCESCGTARHFGPKWTVAEDASVGPVSPDRVVTGTRAGESFVIREPVIDPIDEQWHREAAQMLAQTRREEARTRWLASLPERWTLSYDDGEELVPEVEDRLDRLKSGTKGDHGTSLLCIGPFGSGKTWVAYTYARAAVDRLLLWPQEIRIGTEAEIMEPIALASPWELAATANALLKPTLRMLIIDDVGTLGSYKNQDNRYAAFTKVVNWMYEHKRALVFTTNKTLGEGGELEQWIGPTAYERLKHMVGERQVFRDENKRAELTALWETEYQTMKLKAKRD